MLELIEHRVNSFEKLEVVLALKASPAQAMSMTTLCLSLRLSRDLVRQAVVELRVASLVELTSEDGVQLLPPTTGDEELVSELARLYREDRLAIVKALVDVGISRIRKMTPSADLWCFRRKGQS